MNSTRQEISHINQQFNQLSSSKKLLLTTEKDYMRLSTKIAELNYIEIESVFLSKESEFNQQILNYCNTNFISPSASPILGTKIFLAPLHFIADK